MCVRTTGTWLLPLALGFAGWGAAGALPACSSEDPVPSSGPPIVMAAPPTTPAPPDSVPDPFDVPIAAATAAERELFTVGDRLFETPLRDADGLGPLYTRTSCGACHATGARGPGAVQKMAVVLADG